MRDRIWTWVAVLVLSMVSGAARAAVNWTATNGGSWATGGNWSNGTGPGTADTVLFTDTGASSLPNDPTSILNANRTIGTLSFANSSGKFHTLDLDTRTLTITGNLNFNLDKGTNTTTTVRNGTLVVSGAFANINVGASVAGSASGVASLAGLTSLTANLQDFNIGTTTGSGGTGTLTLSPLNVITTQRMSVGASFNSVDSRGTLHLGLNDTINANELIIGKDTSYGLVDIANGATVNLGTAVQRTSVQIAVQNTNTNQVYSGVLNLGNAAVNLHLDSVVVAQKDGGPGGATGQLLGGGSGSVTIGDQTARSNWVVGYTVNGGGATGTVDFSHLSSLSAYVNDFWVGRGTGGSASGTVSLAGTSTIDAANGILVGVAQGGGTLNLGRVANTILTNQMVVGQDYANGSITIGAGGSLALGTAARRTALTVGAGTTNTNTNYTGTLDLSGGTFNGFLGSVTVGQKDGGPGGATGALIAGNGGSVDIGAPGNTANFYIGRTLSGGGSNGTVDFGGLDTMTASLNTLSVGTAVSGSASGSLQLAASSNINANTILVGIGSGSGSIGLGRTTNTIVANQFTIGQDYASGSVTIPAGASLTLGTPAKRGNLTIASATTNTANVYTGTLDLTDATVTAYLNSVVIGNKNAMPGGEVGTFTISTKPTNHVEASSITLGSGPSSGTLNFGGGVLYAGSIVRGSGTGTFNWTGGQVGVGTVGTPTVSFNLNNTGTGTLAPGTATTPVGTTTVYGNYTQVASAATQIDIAGASADAGNDLLNVSGTATLAGTLALKTLNGFTPSVGQNFLIATYGTRSGTYGFVAPPHLPQDVAFALDYATSPTQLTVRMVAPVAQNWAAATSTTTWATPANWDNATTPGTTNNVTLSNTTAAAKTLSVTSSTTVHRITLQGTNAPLNLEVQQGVRLGVSNQLVVGTNATLSGGGQVLGDVVIGGAGTVAPGAPTNALAVSGDLTGNVTGMVKVSLGGSPDSGAYGRINVAGAANLRGALNVTLSGGFVPAALDSFQVLTFGSRSGRFDSFTNLDIPGALTMAPVYSSTDLRLTATLPGDATLNGTVDFNDLVKLAQNYNNSVVGAADGGWLEGDFTSDGIVDFNDLVKLAQNYNTSATSAAGPIAGSAAFEADVSRAFASVPEPGNMFVILAVVGLGLQRRRGV